ncbi:putative PB1 domain, Zinc finger, ZZ-type, UBA-like superfamily, immunoglobulin-like protein [Helianthus annuus]|nr:putative PB1 domain, Zinc finger, ZZ-type, UBA-like superfamily, immunoglobulin-like protein [Helianthus annuus]
MASSSIVIKVKFGETLRRFIASVNDKKLALDIDMLMEKIRGLFSFGSDVEFTMTYVDEDGDVVTLADDDDLHDVVRQSLNPVRITVNLKSSNSNASSGNSTPMRSQNPLPFQTLNSGISEIINSVPEPLREALSKLHLDLASKTSSSAPVAELVEKMKALYLNQVASKKANPPTEGPSNVKSEPSSVETKVQVNPEAGSSNSKKKEKQVQKAPVNSTKSVGEGSTGKGKNTIGGVEIKKEFGSEKKDDISSGAFNEPLKPDLLSPHYFEQLHQMNQHLQDGIVGQGSQSAQGHHRHSRGPHWKRHGLVSNGIGSIFHMGVCCDGCGVHPITGPRFKSKVKENYDLCNVCFAGMGNATDYIRIDRPTTSFRRQHMPFKGFYDPSFRIPPPTLPHAMRAPGSKLPRSKLDSRFILDVNVLDGTIMAPFTAFTKIWRMRNNGTVIWPHGSQLQWIGGDRLSNSDFVDVEIPVDGLPVDKELDIAVDFTAPELPGRYVSYWRMASPSGQKFGQRVWVLIQVDAAMKDLGETSINLNLPPVTRNPEVVNQDLVMDNILSGNNIIKVTDSGNTFGDFSPKDDEMNFPINDSLIIDNGGVSSTMATLSAPPATASNPVYNPAQVASALASLPAGPTFSSGLYPTVGLDTMVDFSVPPPAVVSGAPSSPPTVAAVKPSGSVSREVSEQQEQALVKELEEMGFKQLDLNTEVLRMNDYDLEKSIDDLCGVLEWDPMLDELQEMGFADTEANRRLLKKNNGSIKRVVMDLINGERA